MKQKYVRVWGIWSEYNHELDSKLKKINFDCPSLIGEELAFSNRLWIDVKNSQFCFGDSYDHCAWLRCSIRVLDDGKVYELTPLDTTYTQVIVFTEDRRHIQYFDRATMEPLTGKRLLAAITVRYLLDCALDDYGWNSRLEKRVTECVDAVHDILDTPVASPLVKKIGTKMDNSTETLVRVHNWLQGLLQFHRCLGEVLEIPVDSAYYYLDLITKALQVKPEDLPNERQDYTIIDDTPSV